MELRHVLSFIAVAEEMNVGRAARRLHIAQPPLTRRIQQLEQDLGVALFERRHKRLHLTAAGREFLGEARLLISQSDRARRTAERAARGEIGRLGIGCVESATASGILPAAVARYRKTFPDVELELVEATSLRQIDAIRKQQLDVGFIHTRPLDDSGLAFRSVRRGRDVAAVSKDHPLAKRRQIPIGLLAREPIILWERNGNPARYDAILAALRATGGPARVVQHATFMQTLVGLAAARLGVALIPDAYASERYRDVVFRPVPGLPVRVDIDLVWRQDDSSPPLVEFMKLVQGLGPS